MSRQLSLEEVCERRAQDAIDKGRALVCTFYLSDKQWAEFSSFFRTKPSKVLSTISTVDEDAELASSWAGREMSGKSRILGAQVSRTKGISW